MTATTRTRAASGFHLWDDRGLVRVRPGSSLCWEAPDKWQPSTTIPKLIVTKNAPTFGNAPVTGFSGRRNTPVTTGTVKAEGPLGSSAYRTAAMHAQAISPENEAAIVWLDFVNALALPIYLLPALEQAARKLKPGATKLQLRKATIKAANKLKIEHPFHKYCPPNTFHDGEECPHEGCPREYNLGTDRHGRTVKFREHEQDPGLQHKGRGIGSDTDDAPEGVQDYPAHARKFTREDNEAPFTRDDNEAPGAEQEDDDARGDYQDIPTSGAGLRTLKHEPAPHMQKKFTTRKKPPYAFQAVEFYDVPCVCRDGKHVLTDQIPLHWRSLWRVVNTGNDVTIVPPRCLCRLTTASGQYCAAHNTHEPHSFRGAPKHATSTWHWRTVPLHHRLTRQQRRERLLRSQVDWSWVGSQERRERILRDQADYWAWMGHNEDVPSRLPRILRIGRWLNRHWLKKPIKWDMAIQFEPERGAVFVSPVDALDVPWKQGLYVALEDRCVDSFSGLVRFAPGLLAHGYRGGRQAPELTLRSDWYLAGYSDKKGQWQRWMAPEHGESDPWPAGILRKHTVEIVKPLTTDPERTTDPGSYVASGACDGIDIIGPPITEIRRPWWIQRYYRYDKLPDWVHTRSPEYQALYRGELVCFEKRGYFDKDENGYRVAYEKNKTRKEPIRDERKRVLIPRGACLMHDDGTHYIDFKLAGVPEEYLDMWGAKRGRGRPSKKEIEAKKRLEYFRDFLTHPLGALNTPSVQVGAWELAEWQKIKTKPERPLLCAAFAVHRRHQVVSESWISAPPPEYRRKSPPGPLARFEPPYQNSPAPFEPLPHLSSWFEPSRVWYIVPKTWFAPFGWTWDAALRRYVRSERMARPQCVEIATHPDGWVWKGAFQPYPNGWNWDGASQRYVRRRFWTTTDMWRRYRGLIPRWEPGYLFAVFSGPRDGVWARGGWQKLDGGRDEPAMVMERSGLVTVGDTNLLPEPIAIPESAKWRPYAGTWKERVFTPNLEPAVAAPQFQAQQFTAPLVCWLPRVHE